MPESYRARCFSCDWGITHELDVVRQDVQQHFDEGCPGPVVALIPTKRASGQAPLQFYNDRYYCSACGMLKTLCLC